MKNKKTSVAILAILIVLALASPMVSAVVSRVVRNNSYRFTYRLPADMYGGGSDHTCVLTTFKMGEKTGYCLNSYILSEDGREYGTGNPSWENIPARLHRLNQTKQRNIELGTVYGWELSSKSNVDALYTKIFVTQESTDMSVSNVSGSGASLAGYNNWKATINQKIQSYLNVDPSFHGSTNNITVGTTMTLTDSNGVLNEYTITNTPAGLTASISGNKLTVTASDSYAGGTLTLKRLNQFQGTSLYYFVTIPGGIWRQPIITPGIPTPKVATIRFNPLEATGKFRIRKTDASGVALSGATFQLRDFSNIPVVSFTMQSGTYISDDLDPGTYTLTETKAPTGYVLDPAPRQIVIVAGETNDVHYNTPIKNNAQQVKVRITKRGVNNTTLAGAVFEVRRGNTVVDTITTNASGIAASVPLPQGTYTLREITAPLGYALSPDTSITLAGDSTGAAVITHDVVIRDNQTVTEISKKDATTGEELPGATLTVKEKESGDVIETWVSTDTPHVIRGLHQGKTYVLTETIAPLGYALSQDVEFTIDGRNGVTNKVEMKDVVQQVKVRITKRSVDNTTLAGAVFEVRRGNTVVDTITTNASGIAESVPLPQGTYTLREITAPLGYALSPDTSITLAGDNTGFAVITHDVVVRDNQTVTEISKKDATTGEELPGATLTVKEKESGEVIETWISTDTPHVIRGLHQGKTYVLTETIAPLGYALSQDVEFTIDGSNGVLNKAEMKDDLTVTEISKKDATTGEEFPGATLTLKEKETGDVIETWVSTDTPHVIRGLYQGKTYILTETIAPLGYALSQDVEFTIDGSNGVTNKVEMEDDLTVTEISKKDATTGEELPGATLTVKEKESGEAIDTWISMEQPHIIRGLHQGKTYVLTEDLAPLGYALCQDVEFTIKGAHGVINKVEMTDELTVTEISKKDATTGEELPGATLTVKEKESGDVIETWVSTDTPHVIRGLHQDKTYVLTETIAPLGYALSQDVEFTIDGKNGVVNKVEMKDELTVTEISKKDFDSMTELKDAVLILREKESGKYIKIWRTENAPHVIEGLHQGKTYQIIEYKAPLGYALSEIVEFTVDGSNGVTNKVEMTDKLTVTEISKKDATTGEELPGATLTLKEKETGDVIETWVSTDTPHVIRGLHQGKTYVLTEDLAPLGYALSQNVEFTVDGSNGVTNKVEMKDDLTVTEISKKDATTGEELPGATLAVIEKESGEVIESWISTKEPHVIRGLHQGKTYVLQEIEAPDGYIKGEDIEFTIDGSNSAVNTISLENIKMVPKTGETGGDPIFGALVLMIGAAGIIIITRLKQHEKA